MEFSNNSHFVTGTRTDMWTTILVNVALALAFVAALVYYYLTRHFSYWERRGVYCPKPEIFFGNIRGLVQRRIALTEFFKDYYDEHKDHKVVGIYRMSTPALVIRDLDILKHILIKDFDHFLDRGLEFSEDGLGLNMFHSDGDKWRVLRSKFSPIFTSSKLKGMMPLMIQQADKWMQHLEPMVARRPEGPIYPLMQKFTIGAIASCAFGMDIPMEELDREGNIYSKIDKLILRLSYATEFDYLFPGMLRKLNLSLMPGFITEFFGGLVKQIVQERNGVKSGRKDFMDLIIDIQSEGMLHGARRDTGEAATLEVSDNVVAAQAFIFYAAGYETSASTSSFLLHELAYHPDIQDRLAAEIKQMLADDGQYTFEGLMKMQYMGQVIDETLRMYPLLDPLQRRVVTKSYKLPGTDVTLEKGMIVLIPVRGIHYDPQYWSEPERFDPDRFSEERSSGRHTCAHMPFGLGPRNCVGTRFAQFQTRLLLSRLLASYRVEPAAATKRHHSFHPYRPVVGIIGDFQLKLVPRNPPSF